MTTTILTEPPDTAELQEFFWEGEKTYRFLSHVFFKELSEEAIEGLALGEYGESTGNECLDRGNRMIGRYFAFSGTDRRTQLACEYARIFLAAGTYTESRATAIPYESVFTSEEKLVMQGARDDVLLYYALDGFQVDPALHEPEDHLSFELEYLANMNGRAESLVAAGDWDELLANMSRQGRFIESHLLNWLSALRETAQEYSQLTFYIGMLLVTEGYLQEYRAYFRFLQELLETGDCPQEHRAHPGMLQDASPEPSASSAPSTPSAPSAS